MKTTTASSKSAGAAQAPVSAKPPVSSSLILKGLQPVEISTPDAARRKRDVLLASAQSCTIIDSPAVAERVNADLHALKEFSSMIEADRKSVKAPVLDIAGRIDELARDLTAKVNAEAARLGALLGTWQLEQDRLAADARRRAQEEEDRIKREADAQAAEAQRAADERAQDLLRQAGGARTQVQRDRLTTQASVLQASAGQAVQEIAQAAQANVASLRATAVTPARVAGPAVRREMLFEVTDLAALYRAQPLLVTLSPNNAAIKAVLKNLPDGATLPGVHHWTEARASVR